MFKLIMVPLDGGRFAEAALPVAVSLARRDGGRLLLVAAVQPLPESDSGSSWDRDRRGWFESDRKVLEAYIRDTSARLSSQGVSVDAHILEGNVDDALPRWTATADLDLVVMATHARGPLVRAWLGSAGDHMVRSGRHPVLLVHPTEEAAARGLDTPVPAPPQKILVPLDGSPLAERALDPTALAGGAASPHLVLLQVVPTAPNLGEAAIPDEVIERASEEAERYLGEVSRRVSSWAGRVETEVLVAANAADAIDGVAADQSVDLVAMATRGRGGIVRAVLGSVADRVIRTASVPVLLFPVTD